MKLQGLMCYRSFKNIKFPRGKGQLSADIWKHSSDIASKQSLQETYYVLINQIFDHALSTACHKCHRNCSFQFLCLPACLFRKNVLKWPLSIWVFSLHRCYELILHHVVNWDQSESRKILRWTMISNINLRSRRFKPCSVHAFFHGFLRNYLTRQC